MAVVDLEERQLTLKIVYCGPALAGKTTNLSKLHEKMHENHRGRLMTLDADADRTLFFDLLPLFFEVSGLSVGIKVYSVPGQPAHQMTRRAVLRGADGVVFVADSAPGSGAQNRLAYAELVENLSRLGASVDEVAVITQFNKRDVPESCAPHSFGGEPVEEACAEQGEGVVATFLSAAQASWAMVEVRGRLQEHLGVSEDEFSRALAGHLSTSAKLRS